VKGNGAFAVFKHEAGVHRVQRVPATESQGRIHTSTATVAVLPEVEDIEVTIDLNDVKRDVYRSTVRAAERQHHRLGVRLTHLPTGIGVSMQARKTSCRTMSVRCWCCAPTSCTSARPRRARGPGFGARRSQLGTGERSEKVRT